jgi:mono/diheme cytochrome c family protein
MKRLTIMSLSAFLFIGMSGTVFAEKGSIGATEYQNNCASCHGAKGEGNGPFTEFLKAVPSSLTTLSKDNGGVFPFERVYQAIDGRGEVKSHGPREMPVWGKDYIAGSVEVHGPFFGEWYGEDILNARILALIDHINKLQKK